MASTFSALVIEFPEVVNTWNSHPREPFGRAALAVGTQGWNEQTGKHC